MTRVGPRSTSPLTRRWSPSCFTSGMTRGLAGSIVECGSCFGPHVVRNPETRPNIQVFFFFCDFDGSCFCCFRLCIQSGPTQTPSALDATRRFTWRWPPVATRWSVSTPCLWVAPKVRAVFDWSLSVGAAFFPWCFPPPLSLALPFFDLRCLLSHCLPF